MNKKILALMVVASISLLALAGCGSNGGESQVQGSESSSVEEPADNSNATEVNAGVISDVSASDAELHEEIDLQTFTEGEVVDNPYYKRTTDENGTPVFAVIKKASGQVAYLPFDKTTVYYTDEGPCYFEKKTLTFSLDGVEQTTEAFELWVTNGSPLAEEPAEGADTGDSVG